MPGVADEEENDLGDSSGASPSSSSADLDDPKKTWRSVYHYKKKCLLQRKKSKQ